MLYKFQTNPNENINHLQTQLSTWNICENGYNNMLINYTYHVYTWLNNSTFAYNEHILRNVGRSVSVDPTTTIFTVYITHRQ